MHEIPISKAEETFSIVFDRKLKELQSFYKSNILFWMFQDDQGDLERTEMPNTITARYISERIGHTWAAHSYFDVALHWRGNFIKARTEQLM